jgi:WD40 repeat protein
MRMKITADDEKLLVGDDYGYLILISSRDGQGIKDFGPAVFFRVTGIMLTADQKFFFTSSSDGKLKQWNYEDNNLARDHGMINKRIVSLC